MSYDVFPTQKFKDHVKTLQKKFRSIGDDLKLYIKAFEQDVLPGDPNLRIFWQNI